MQTPGRGSTECTNMGWLSRRKDHFPERTLTGTPLKLMKGQEALKETRVSAIYCTEMQKDDKKCCIKEFILQWIIIINSHS